VGKTISRGPDFKPQSSHAQNGVAMIFDLGGFSKFFNQPDVHTYIPRYLNHVRKCVEIALLGGKAFWLTEETQTVAPLYPRPVHRKFLGDGYLYIWMSLKGSNEFTAPFVANLCNNLWNLQKHFFRVNRACSDDVPVFELPNTIRFGLARGTVFELSMEKTTSREYIGVCINLASRLQKYCPGLNFLASARLEIPETMLSKHGYIRTVATKIKGFPREILIVDKDEFEDLPEETKTELFTDI
jgi:hypothetical protein